MEPQITSAEEIRSANHGVQKSISHQFPVGDEEFHKLLTTPENGNSFTALLELPPTQAMELLTDTNNINNNHPAGNLHNDNYNDVVKRHRISAFNHSLSTLPAFPSNRALVERAAKYSVFATEDSSELKVKSEPLDSNGNPNLSDLKDGSESEKEKPLKRKEREKKGKGSSKKSKTTALDDDGEKLPYVHVRARRGQATDSHSLAERARREKINARMKLLQELVPGCNKISGTALVLDEIINHVQYLQRQVEYLSMRLASVNPRVDFNLDSLISGNDSMMSCNFLGMPTPLMWPEVHLEGDRHQIQQQWHGQSLTQPVWVKEGNQRNLLASDNSLMTYESPANSASLHSSQLKMEL